MYTKTEALERAKTTELKLRNKNGTRRVNYSDFERWIMAVFGKKFSVPAALECGNDTTLDYVDVGSQKYVEPGKRDEVSAWLYGEGPAPEDTLSPLLEVLCLDGFLEPGDYLIRVSW